MKKAFSIVTSILLSLGTCVQVLPVSAQGNQYVPDGTTIVTSMKNQNVTVICYASTACSAFLKEVASGTLTLREHPSQKKSSYSVSSLDPKDLTWNDQESPSSLTIGGADIQNVFTSVPPDGSILLAEIDTPSYMQVVEGSEGYSMMPRTACSIAYDDGTLKITCSDEKDGNLIDQFTTGSSISLEMEKQSEDTYIWAGSGNLVNYTVSEDKKSILISEDTLRLSGLSITAGEYQMSLFYHGNRSRYYQLGTVDIPQDMNVKKPAPDGVLVSADDDGIYVTCDQTNDTNANACSTYLNQFYDTAFLTNGQPKGRNYYDYNSQLELLGVLGPGGWFPYYWDNTNPLEKRTDQETGLTTRIYVPTSHINEKLHLPAGTKFPGTAGSCLRVLEYQDVPINYDVVLTNGVKDFNPESIHLRAEQLDGAHDWQLKLTADKTQAAYDYLSTVTGFGIDSRGGGSGGQIIEEENSYSILAPAILMLNPYASWKAEPGKTISMTVSNSQYVSVYIDCKISEDSPFRQMPDNVQISVVGEGFRISVLGDDDNGLLDDLDNETPVPSFEKDLGEGETYTKIYGTIEDKIIPNGDGRAFYKYYNSSTWNKYTDANGKSYVLVSADYKDLGLDKTRDLNKNYYFRLIDSHYWMTMLSAHGQSVNPLILAQASRSGDPQSAVEADTKLDALKDLDGYSITTTDSDKYNGGLKNVNVSVDKTGDAADVVEINGAVAAALTTSNTRSADGTVESDLTDINYANDSGSSGSQVAITVTQDVKQLDEETAKTIVSKAGDSSLTATDVRFDVTLSKSYENVDQQDVTVTELPYEAALVVDVPSENLAAGEEYVLLREHNGQVDEIPVEVSDGKAVAYTDRFSSFVVAKKKVSKSESKSSSTKAAASAGYDDGSPFTRDAQGNVYDRWGNKIWTNADGSVTRKGVPATGIRE